MNRTIRLCTVVAVFTAAIAVAGGGTAPAVAGAGTATPSMMGTTAAAAPATVSLTFDDGKSNQLDGARILAAAGMRGTFYVNSGRIGKAGYMTTAQLRDLQVAGHEVGGHTVTHADLTSLSRDEAAREICNDRLTLHEWGVSTTSFAYPFSAFDENVKAIVSECGYNSGRAVGGLGCSGCPAGGSIPPRDAYAVPTPVSIKTSTTLQQMKDQVIAAQQSGGGWVPIVMHDVCAACSTLAVSTDQLGQFTSWLASEVSAGRAVVRTVAEVIGGAVAAPIAGPTPPGPGGGNLVSNPSLEIDADGNRVPDCFLRGGFGTNTATWTRTTDARTGSWADRVDISSYTSGDRKLVTAQDLGACAPAVEPGRSYELRTSYRSTARTQFVVLLRDGIGGWTYWTQSPSLAAAGSWSEAVWTTPPVPSGATAISFGLSLATVGSLTVDDFSLVDPSAQRDVTGPEVRVTAPTAGSTVRGNAVAVAADAADASGIEVVEFYADGETLLGRDTTAPYGVSWDTTATQHATVEIIALAVDRAGNRSTSTPVSVIVDNRTPDTTAPTTSITSPADASVVSGTITVSAHATDDTGVQRVRLYVGSTLVGSDDTAPYSWLWNTATVADGTHRLEVRAEDAAGNIGTASVSVVVRNALSDTTSPTVAITEPVSGSTVTRTVTVSANASDDVGIASVQFYVGTALIGTATTAPYSVRWNTKKVAPGTHSLTAVATDRSGNSTRSAAVTVTVR